MRQLKSRNLDLLKLQVQKQYVPQIFDSNVQCAGIYILVSTRPTVGANQMLLGHWMQKIYFWIMNANVELI